MKKQKVVRLRMGRIYLYFLLVLLMCALALHAAYLIQSYYSLMNQAQMEREQILLQKAYHTERYLEEIEDCANTLCISPRLQQVLIERQRLDYLAFADCRDLLSEYGMAPYDIYRIDFYVMSSQSLITSSEGVFYGLEDTDRAIYEQLLKRSLEEQSFWTLDYQMREPGLVSRTRNIRYITLVKRVASLYTGKTRGLLLLSVPYEHFASINAQNADDEYSCIIFEDQLLCGEQVQDDAWIKLSKTSQHSGFGFEYYYQFNDSSLFSTGFLVVMAVIMLLFLLGFVSIVYIAEKRVAKPIKRLLHGFERMEEGRFIKRMGNHEDAIFGELNRGFDHMTEHLENTVTALVDERTRGKELKQRLLMMQIKPHFLYNIFNNMIWLVEQKKYENLEQLVTATAGFYKTTLNAGAGDVMIYDNMRQLEYYVRIQKFRFGDRFDLKMEIDDEAQEMLIPNMLLQPLVENAIGHGFQDLQRRGVIGVTAQVQEKQLVIHVRDNGNGIDPALLKEIQEAMARESGRADRFFALVNVAGRLHNRYNGAASIEIDSTPGEGTVVQICIPITA